MTNINLKYKNSMRCKQLPSNLDTRQRHTI